MSAERMTSDVDISKHLRRWVSSPKANIHGSVLNNCGLAGVQGFAGAATDVPHPINDEPMSFMGFVAQMTSEQLRRAENSTRRTLNYIRNGDSWSDLPPNNAPLSEVWRDHIDPLRRLGTFTAPVRRAIESFELVGMPSKIDMDWVAKRYAYNNYIAELAGLRANRGLAIAPGVLDRHCTVKEACEKLVRKMRGYSMFVFSGSAGQFCRRTGNIGHYNDVFSAALFAHYLAQHTGWYITQSQITHNGSGDALIATWTVSPTLDRTYADMADAEERRSVRWAQ